MSLTHIINFIPLILIMDNLVNLDSTISKFNSSAITISLLESFLYTGHENGELHIINLLKKNPKGKKIIAH